MRAGFAPSAPRIGEEGLPFILIGVAATGLALTALLYWGKKKADDPRFQATR